MFGGQRDADAGVRGQLMTETFVGLPDRIENPAHEIGNIGGSFDRGLNDGEFVASQPSDEVGAGDALTEARGHRFQQFVANHMSE